MLLHVRRSRLPITERTPDPEFLKLPLEERLKQQPPLKVRHLYIQQWA